MCVLYALKSRTAQLQSLFGAQGTLDEAMADQRGIYPDRRAAVVHRDADGARQLATMRWGFPPPPNLSKRPVVNVRNLHSPYWRPYLKPAQRCLIPATAFSEYSDSRPKKVHWFGLRDVQPVFAFAGIWRRWSGLRRGEEGEHLLFAFLTCPPSEDVAPIHSKAMPVVLAGPESWEAWLQAPVPELEALQQPLPAGRLAVSAPD